MSMLFVKLRESGEVLEVEESLHSAMGVRPDAWIYFHTLDETCDLCDEQGRLLKPEDPTQALKDKLLEQYRTADVYSVNDCNCQQCIKIRDLEAKLKQLNTKTP